MSLKIFTLFALSCLLGAIVVEACGGGSKPPPRCTFRTCRASYNGWEAVTVNAGQCKTQYNRVRHNYQSHTRNGGCPEYTHRLLFRRFCPLGKKPMLFWTLCAGFLQPFSTLWTLKLSKATAKNVFRVFRVNKNSPSFKCLTSITWSVLILKDPFFMRKNRIENLNMRISRRTGNHHRWVIESFFSGYEFVICSHKISFKIHFNSKWI